jgi:hypothetical protein
MTGNTPVMTEIVVHILGGRWDAWTGRIRIPLEEEAAKHIRFKGTVYRVLHRDGRILLVHPTAQKLFWSA